MKIAFLVTSHNRREKTRNCIETVRSAVLYARSRGLVVEDEWFITDAGSSDGTVEMLKSLPGESTIHICEGSQDIFYSQGMRKSMQMLKQDVKDKDFSFVVLVNDDVIFNEDFLYLLLDKEKSCDGPVVLAGATSHDGRQSYGGVRYNSFRTHKNNLLINPISYKMVSIEEEDLRCHTFNANCVFIPWEIFETCDIIDEHFIHGLGDFDYGLGILKKGYQILSTDFYVGDCANNSKSGSFMDRSLTRRQRIKKLQSVKGSPTGPWFYFLNKHFGFATAICYSVSPYVKIILGK